MEKSSKSKEGSFAEPKRNQNLTMKLPDEIAVSLVTAACVIGLAVLFKNVFNVNAPFLFSIAAPIYPFIVF
jgi:hypothetical protein